MARTRPQPLLSANENGLYRSVGDFCVDPWRPRRRWSARSGLLPAFSRFTGRNVYRPVASETVFVIAEDQVLQVS